MIFSDPTKVTPALIQRCEFRLFGDNGYGRITNNPDLLYQFTDRINRAQDKFQFIAMNADGRWQFDDTNDTDYPIATTDLVLGQRDYTFALEHIEIEKVLIKDPTGVWNLMDRTTDTTDTFGTGMARNTAKTYLENNTGNTGTPVAYDKMANSIIFDKSPNYNSTGGLKIYFKRGPSYFVYTDTTKVPGFASIFHEYLVSKSCQEYASDREMPVAGGRLRNGAYTGMALEVQDKESAIQKFFSLRNRDEKTKMSPRIDDTR